MFGGMAGGFGGMGGRRPRRSDNINHKLSVGLEGFYLGKTFKINLTKKVTCLQCDGSGASDPEKVKGCEKCGGSGTCMQARQLGPGMMHQVQAVCPDCEGSGSHCEEEFYCVHCKGSKLDTITKLLDVKVERGMKKGERIVFKGEADEVPGQETGDVIFTLEEKPHPIFKRRGPNLEIRREINLLEALTGFKFLVEHLDGRKILVQHTRGQVIKPGDAKVVLEEGMPIKGSTEFGALVIEFDVVFPESGALSEMEQVALERVLPKSASEDIAASVLEDVEGQVSTYVLEELDRESLPKEQPENYGDDDGPGGNPGGAHGGQE